MGPSEAQWKLGDLAVKAEQGYTAADVAEGRECAAAIEYWRQLGDLARQVAVTDRGRFADEVGVSRADLDEAVEIARRAAAPPQDWCPEGGGWVPVDHTHQCPACRKWVPHGQEHRHRRRPPWRSGGEER
jgi:hypothetical protein